MSKEEREERVVLLHQSITERFHLNELDESFCLHRTWKAKKKKKQHQNKSGERVKKSERSESSCECRV